MIHEVLRQRDAGVSLQTAIGQADARSRQPEPSVFAGLRRRHPYLAPQLLRKVTLLALTRAIEDECCARAEHPVLFATFQSEQFYLRSRSRWAELARTARAAVVFADFEEQSAAGASPLQVAVPRGAPLRREWALVCDASDYPACLAGWELPGQDGLPDADRRFEMVWTVDPRVVRDAARICVGLTRSSAPDLGGSLSDLLVGTPPAASADLRRSAGLLNRMLAYVEAASAQ